MGKFRQRASATVISLGTAVAVALTGATPAVAAVADDPGIVNIADTDATAETNSMFRYLRDQQGNGTLFGHQHTTDSGITFSEADGVSSDVLAGTGDHPAIFGWDTLILEGREAPGSGTLEANGEQNAHIWADGMKDAHALGGINTISAHMYNFATGEDFSSTTGRPVRTILPGGSKNAEFNDYLDLIALTASLTVDGNGNDIPLIFRPFHENTGSWFWWGAAHATTGEYKEIFRYTVEYLRDVKGVDNLLYSFSPNGTFGGDQERYLETYPGDEYIDIIGYDFYENSNEPENSETWISQLIPDLAMITDIAEERGKISAFTEFGRNGDRTIKESGNKSLQFYTDLLDAIKADPKAKRISYMQTWSNWGLEQFYVPYPATDTLPEHEMYQDFLAFYEDDFTVFADEVADDAFTRPASPAEQDATFRLVSPADGVRITSESTTVRAKATTDSPSDVYFTVDDDTTRHPLSLDGDYFTGEWEIGSEALVNGPATITVVADYADGTQRTASSDVILGGAPVFPVGVIDDFEGYGSDAALRAAYAFNNDASDLISLSMDGVGAGGMAVAFDYEFGPRNYAGFGKAFDGAQDWTAFNQVNAWLAPDGGNQKLVLQFDAGGQTFEAYPSLAGTEPTELAISFADFRNKADPTLSPTAAQLASVTQFYIYMNQVGEASSGRILLDDIRAVEGNAEPVLPGAPGGPGGAGPSIIEDFEGYADDAALRAGWSRGGASTISLSAGNKSTGEFGGAFPYTAGFDEFQRAISADWSQLDELSMWVTPDGNDQRITLQLVAGGNFYDATVQLTGTAPVEVTIPFSDFVPSQFQGRDASLRLTPTELRRATSLAMFIEDSPTTVVPAAGVLYFDDLRARASGESPTDPADPVDPTDPSVPLAPRVAEDFERYADDTALAAVWNRNARFVPKLADGIGDGEFAGRFDFDFRAQDYADFGMYLNADWSEYDALSLWVQPDGSDRIVSVQVKAGGVFWDATLPAVTGTQAVVVSVPFSEFTPASYQEVTPPPVATDRPTAEQLTLVENLSIFIHRGDAENADTGTYYVDNIQVVQLADPVDPSDPPAGPAVPADPTGQPAGSAVSGGSTTHGGGLAMTGINGDSALTLGLGALIVLVLGAALTFLARRPKLS